MKGAEMFTGWPVDRALHVGLLCRLALKDAHMRAGLQFVLAVDHDGLAGLQAGIDQGLALTDLGDPDRPYLYRLIRQNDVDIGTGRTLLHGAGRDGQPLGLGPEQQTRVYQLAGPEQAPRIWKSCTQTDGARGLDDLVVDQQQLALIELDFLVLAVGENLDGAFLHLLLDFGKRGLGQREDQRDRLDLG